MTLIMNKADYDEHLVMAISNSQLQGIDCELETSGTLEISAEDDIIRALETLKGAGVEDIADTLGAYGIEFATPASLGRNVLCSFAANQLALIRSIAAVQGKAFYYGYKWDSGGDLGEEAGKKMDALFEALRAFNAWKDE
jgi:hypothetical protein